MASLRQTGRCIVAEDDVSPCPRLYESPVGMSFSTGNAIYLYVFFVEAVSDGDTVFVNEHGRAATSQDLEGLVKGVSMANARPLSYGFVRIYR